MFSMQRTRRLVSLILVIALMLSGSYTYATPVIGGVNGTSVNYDEVSGAPVVAMPGLNISSDKQFDQNSYVEYWIDSANTHDNLGLQEVADANAISTVDGSISVFRGIVYKGNGVTYDAIASVDSILDGQNGSKLRIAFERALPNANFLEGTTGVNLSTNELTGWEITHGTFNLTAAGLNTRSLSRAYDSIDATGSPVVITGPGNAYTYTTNFDYSSGVSPSSIYAWSRESREAPNGTLTTSVMIDTTNGGTGGRSLTLQSNGSVTANPTPPNSSFGSHFGPVVVSAPFLATAGEQISLDWKAQFISDHYEVYGFVVETKGTADISDDTHHLMFYSRGENQVWTTATGTIPNTGEYKFMFINGTYDKTGGLAVGSRMWIDNVKVFGTKYSAQIVEDIALLVTYFNTSVDPENTRTLNIKVVDEDGEGTAVTDTSTINISNQFSHPPTLTSTGLNPNFNKGVTSTGSLFAATSSSTVEAADRFVELTLTIDGLADGDHEILGVDGEEIQVINNTSGVTMTNSVGYAIGITNTTATITLTHAGLTTAQMNSLVNGLFYNNSLAVLSLGNRVITLIETKDNGSLGIGANGFNTTALSHIATVRISNIILDLTLVGRNSTTADFVWTEPVGATMLQLQQSTNGGVTWTNSTHPALVANAGSTSVTGLTGLQDYTFRLVVTDGDNSGISNVVSAEALSSNTLLTATQFVISSGQTLNENITIVPEGMTKAAFLSEITKGHAAQTLDDSLLSEPIAVGDLLVVTAENGASVTTYTVQSLKLMSLAEAGKTDSSVSLKWPALAGAIGLQVEFSRDGGQTWISWKDNPLATNSREVTITGLNPGTYYDFRLVVTGGSFNGISNTVTIRTDYEEYVPTPIIPAKPEKVIVIVNGQEENAGIIKNELINGRDVVIIEVDRETIDEKIEAVLKEANPNETNRIQVPIVNTKTDFSHVQLTGDIVKKLEDNDFDISVKWNEVNYILPAEELTIRHVANQLGIQEEDLKSIIVEVQISKVPEQESQKLTDMVQASGNTLLFPPTDFNIVAMTTHADGTQENIQIERFSQFVSREIQLPNDITAEKITTGIVFNADGSFEHIPTEVFRGDGPYYARLNSLTNSTYSVIWNPNELASVENHWSKGAVNDMASRLVVDEKITFNPEAKVTREEFTVYIVKALGLYRSSGIDLQGLNRFSDLSGGKVNSNAIAIALDWGIVNGYPDQTFQPFNTITREEAMVMYANAMNLTRLFSTESRMHLFEDAKLVSSWALPFVEDVVNANVFNGRSIDRLVPKGEITHAEALQAIHNLLTESDLINK